MRTVQVHCDDGRVMPAVLTSPSDAVADRSTLAITHHGGPGGTPLGGVFTPITEALVAQGIAVLGLSSRMAADFATAPFDAYAADVAAAVRFAKQLGYASIVLIGHSMGCAVVTRYLAESRDPAVVGLVHLAPTVPLPTWAREGLGDEAYTALVERARAIVADGRGGTDFVDAEFDVPAPNPNGLRTRHVLTAHTWLSWYGPQAPTNHGLLSLVETPALLLCGDRDDFNSRAHFDAATSAAAEGNPDAVETRWYEGGIGHDFRGAQDAVAADIAAWVAALLPTLPVRVIACSVPSQGGTRAAVRYEPDTADAPRLGVVVLPDLDGESLGAASHVWARALASHGVEVLHVLPSPGGYLPLSRGGLETQAGIASFWVEALRAPERIVLACGNAALLLAAARVAGIDLAPSAVVDPRSTDELTATAPLDAAIIAGPAVGGASDIHLVPALRRDRRAGVLTTRDVPVAGVLPIPTGFRTIASSALTQAGAPAALAALTTSPAP